MAATACTAHDRVMTRFALTIVVASLVCGVCAFGAALLLSVPWALAGTRPFGTSRLPATDVWPPVVGMASGLLVTARVLIKADRARRLSGGLRVSPAARRS